MNPLILLLGFLAAGMGAGGGSGGEGGTARPSTDDVTPPGTGGDADDGPTVVTDDTPDPVVVDPDPDAPDQPGTTETGGGTDPVITSDSILEVMAGRVTTIAPEGDDVVSVKIISGVDEGHVTVNPDNTMALVMTLSDFTGAQAFTYEVARADGSIETHEVNLNVVEGVQAAGWGTGESHYMLAVDENDKVIVETGDNHTKVYVSGSESALSLSDIAAMEGLAIEDITGAWLAEQGSYGQSEDLALDAEAGRLMWEAVTPRWSTTSNHLLFERGYEYGDMGRMVLRSADGESELQPVLIGAYGEGDKPIIDSKILVHQEPTTNIVFQDVHITGGARLIMPEDWIFDNVTFTEAGVGISDGLGVTFHNSSIFDIARDDPAFGDDWHAHTDRLTGLYAQKSEGILIEGVFVDHIGWTEGYAEGDVQPPSMFSHNIYINAENWDLTVRDTITMQASSFGIVARSGGFFEDILFLDNNAAMDTYGGDYEGSGAIGNYTLISGTVVTSAGHRFADQIGAVSAGIWDSGNLSTWVDNIIAHLADPNNQDEIDAKVVPHAPIRQDDPYYDDTILYRWNSEEYYFHPDQNVDDLDTDVLDQTTIQLFTAALLGDDNATIGDLADYLRAQYGSDAEKIVDADLIIEFFREGFGLEVDLRGEAETLQFVPNDIGDGVRWDNRLNWDTQDLPGTQDGDSVDLNGNEVVYGGTTTLSGLDMGDGGALRVPHGKLTVESAIEAGPSGAQISIDGAGQLWAEGYAGEGALDLDVDGGRFANTGEMTNTDLTVTDGQALLAVDDAEFELSAGRTLAIIDAASKVGFDGEDGGIALLDLEEGSTVQFSGTELETIEEFRSGALGDETNVQSGINLGDATLEIDLNNLSTDLGTTLTLMDADELIGIFDEATSSIGGLGDRDATIVIDYEEDVVRLELSPGSGAVSFQTVGEETTFDDGEEALWAALTAEQGIASEELPDPSLEDELIDAA